MRDVELRVKEDDPNCLEVDLNSLVPHGQDLDGEGIRTMEDAQSTALAWMIDL